MDLGICRICLRTDEPLQEIKKNLLQYFKEICNCTSRNAEYLFCTLCIESLKNNLDFRNSCIKANSILLDWKRNRSQKKPTLQSLHDVLKISLKYMVFNEKSESEQSETIISNNSANDNNNIQDIEEEIKVESIKDEDVSFETIDCDTIYYKVTTENHNGQAIKTNGHKIDNDEQKSLNDEQKSLNDEQKLLNDEQMIQNDEQKLLNDEQKLQNDELSLKNDEKVMQYDEDVINNDDDDDDDDKFLIDCVKVKRKRRKNEIYQAKGPPRKVISDFSQYEAMFDIQLFATHEEARKELMERKVSEPYISAKYRCELCYTVFKSEKLLPFHMKWHDPSLDYECEICHRRFASSRTKISHKAKNHRGKFSCKLCPLVTYYLTAMKTHSQKHEGRNFDCQICGKAFNHISTYLTHKRMVHESAHVCGVCARTFVSKLGLKAHTHKMHKKQSIDKEHADTVRCEQCDLTFVNQNIYNVHVLNTDVHKEAAKGIIACRYCGLPFENITQLKTHKRSYHPKKKDTNDMIKCNMCDAEGKGRAWRFRHYTAEHPNVNYLEKVSEAKKHMCDQCGKLFSNICILKDHMNKHLGVRPYACEKCPATFSSLVSRAHHAQRHAPPRACKHCPATFKSSSNLIVHMRKHTGIRRHICAICSKAFLHRAALREHERGVHQNQRRQRGKTNKT